MATTRLRIEQLGPLADGISQGNRGTVYVDRAVPGDLLEVQIRMDEKRIPRGTIVKIIEASPHRVEPPCPHYDFCGNCSLQHVNITYYQKWKEQKVVDAFSKMGLSPRKWLPPIFLKGQNRRRATFSLTKQKGRTLLGYYQRRSKLIFDIQTCEVISSELLEAALFFKPLLAPLILEDQTIDIFVQKVGKQLDLVISEIPSLPKSVVKELCQIPGVGRVSLKTNRGIQVVSENKLLFITFGSLRVALPPASFLQPTEEGEKTLVQSILSALPTGKVFADLFSGAGTFSGPLLNQGEVHAFEDNPHSVRSLTEAAKGKSLKVFKRELFKNPVRREELNRFDAIIFDPPRAGCPEQSNELARSRCKFLIGVSCNPATFARDALYLIKGGYRLKSLQIIDQFLWSHHVEVIGTFSRT